MNAVITGASKGIGKAIAFKLAAAGYDIFFCSRSETENDRLRAELNEKYPGRNCTGIVADCSRPEDVKQFARTVQQQTDFVDVLVNNVGTYRPATILDEDEQTLFLQLQINFLAAYTLCREFGRSMRDAKKGHILNICSIAAIHPVAEAGSYTVTKAALLSLTEVLRLELMKHRVKVTAILPGSTLTSSWDGTTIPAERFVAPEDVADAVIGCLNMSPGANPDKLVITPLEGTI